MPSFFACPFRQHYANIYTYRDFERGVLAGSGSAFRNEVIYGQI